MYLVPVCAEQADLVTLGSMTSLSDVKMHRLEGGRCMSKSHYTDNSKFTNCFLHVGEFSSHYSHQPN